MIEPTMQDFPLTLRLVFDHGRKVHPRSQVTAFDGHTCHTTTFAEVALRVERLSIGLAGLGVRAGDCVGTLCWNTHEHLDAYFAVPLMGAVLHTLNPRLSPEQLAYVINHGGDKVLIVDESLLPVLDGVQSNLRTVEHIIVVGRATGGDSPFPVTEYETLLAGTAGEPPWPELAERTASTMCYTTGTTGDPKGVVYSHRSTVLHTMGLLSTLSLSYRDRVLPAVPMFHVNAWGLVYSAWFCGADLVLPGRHVQAEPLCNLVMQTASTFAAGIPTVWNDVLHLGEQRDDLDLSSLRMIISGGAAVPRMLIERFQARFGVPIYQGWGMTETSPMAAAAFPPRDARPEDEFVWRARTGRVLPGVELRIVDSEGRELAWDGEAIGEIEVRGPWVTTAYHGDEGRESFHDGWLRTGDLGSVDDQGFIQITDRAKDVIKSGGEWISSVELENQLLAHPDVAEAAVIAVEDERWGERPLALVVSREGSSLSAKGLREFLETRVERWQVPERWTFVESLPKTSIGKVDKKRLRARLEAGEFQIEAATSPS